jgi:hypothetical protein
MNDEDLRDCFAMFAMNGLIIFRNGANNAKAVAEDAYTIAEAMVAQRNKEPEPEVEMGIVAAKPRRKKSA